MITRLEGEMAIEPNERVLGPDFIWIKTKTPEEVTSLLLERFPEVRDLASPSEFVLEDTFHAYGLFGAEIRRRIGDREFLQLAGSFINELGESRDPLIENVLEIGLLEDIAQESAAVTAISEYVSPKVKELLREDGGEL